MRSRRHGASWVPEKILWHFSLVHKVKRIFRSPVQANIMTWHARPRVKDCTLCHISQSRHMADICEKETALFHSSVNIGSRTKSSDWWWFWHPNSAIGWDLQLLRMEGVMMRNACRWKNKKQFRMNVMIIFCIHDFPAYRLTAGCDTKGYNGCLACGPNTVSRRSKFVGEKCV